MSYDVAGMFNASAAPLRFPGTCKERVQRYVRQHQGGNLIAEQAPFRRQLDLWAISVAVASASGLDPKPGSSASWGEKFVDTRSVQLGRELAELLVVIAADHFGIEDERLSDPSEVMELANRYAAVGVLEVLKWLEDPSLRTTNIEKVIGNLKRRRTEALSNVGVEEKEVTEEGLAEGHS